MQEENMNNLNAEWKSRLILEFYKIKATNPYYYSPVDVIELLSNMLVIYHSWNGVKQNGKLHVWTLSWLYECQVHLFVLLHLLICSVLKRLLSNDSRVSCKMIIGQK